ncbi:DegT/DnrJ/EryC1/StrS family aminotransferase [Motiliproteus sediminis]|uniref:DegT/DnrJ/EryC1/StrS family aminotransferase n=1 Tax=Motiliproteus sediminis TaxID=1468178 RepID=UPI001AEFD8F0|nr:DegT/DnrJ/EryC1/StrS family aminotransferase [Motiliproteus sediminis]
MLPLIDLKRQYAQIETRVKKAVVDVLDSGQYIQGSEVAELEQRLAAYAGTTYCVSCASGTDALLMALMAKGVGPGSIIFTTPFTFVATAEVIALLGATPFFVDVDPTSFNMDPKQLELAIAACRSRDPGIYPLPAAVIEKEMKPEGVIAVDLFGLPAEYDRINSIAAENDLFVIEDAAQSFGATYRGRKTGGLADIGCTSFFPAKPLGGCGDGGAIFCNDDQTKQLLESIRVHGQGESKYENVRLGVTGRLDAIQAAYLKVKLDIFDDEFKARQKVSAYYNACLQDAEGFRVPCVPEYSASAWAQYTLLASNQERRDRVLEALAAADIGHSIYYPIPLHLQRAFTYLGYQVTDFHVAENLASRVFSIPMHPYLTESEIESVVQVIIRS